MAGDAGGREVGRISIRAVPSTGTFRQDLLAELRKIEADLPRITVGTDVDTTRLTAQVDQAVARAQRLAKNVNIKTDIDGKPLDDLGKKLDGLGKKAKSAGNDLPNLHLGLVGIGSTALSAVPGVFSLAGSLEKVAGAYGLLPGLLEAAGAGVATLAVGLHGVKDALSSKTGADPAKFAAAMANLAPSARKAVTAINNLNPTLHTLQQNVQQSLFAGLSTQIDRLGKTLIPVLNKGMVGVARQANLAAVAFGQFASSAASVRDLGGVFANVTTGFHNLLPAVQPLLSVLRDVGAVSASFLPQLGTGIAHAAASFSTFIATARQTGQLRGWITEGITAVKQLGSIAGSVLKTFQGIVSAAQSVGGGTLGGLAAVMKSIATTVNSPAFQAGLRQFFTGLQAGFAALSSAMPALGSAVAALGPPLAALTQGIGQTLAQAIQALAPAIVQMAPALTTLAASLASLTSAAISTVAPVLTLIAKAASLIVQDVPGAATALGALGVSLLALKAASSAGVDVNLSKIGKSLKDTFQSSAFGKVAIDQLDNFKLGLLGAGDAAAPLATKVGKLASPIKNAGSAALAAVGGFTGIGVAAAAVAGAALLVNANVNRMRAAIDNASEAAGRLKGSMDSGNQSLNAFVLANQRAIGELRSLNAVNQKAYLVQIGFDLINEQGYTPAKAFAALQQLANAAGVTLPITLKVGSLTDVNEQLRAIGTTAVQAAQEIDKDPFGSWSLGASHANELIKGIATSANDALNGGNWAGAVSQIQAFRKALQDSNVPIDAQNTAMLRLSQAFIKQTGYAGLSIDSTQNLTDALTQLGSKASLAPQPLKDYANAVLTAAGPTGDLAAGIASVADQQKYMASDLAHAHVAMSDAGRDMSTLASASQNTASASAVAAANVKLLAAAYVSLNNAITQSIGGDIGMKAAQADVINQAVTLAQQMKKNGDSLSLASAKGRENVAVVSSLAQSFVTAAAATSKWDQDHHRSTTQVRADLEKLRSSLVAQMIQAGVSRAEAKKLADTYLKMPKVTKTEAQFNTAKAKASAASYKSGLEHTWSLLAGDATSKGVLMGQNLADGLASGLASKQAYVNQRSAQLAEESVAAFNHAAGIHSPSKKMIEAGEFMGAGLVIGLVNSIAGVQAASTKVANAALASVSASLKTQPTTREGLSAQYGTLRAAMLATAQASATAAGFYTLAQASVTKTKDATAAASAALAKYTQQQTIHNAATSLSITQARAYLTNEIAVDRQHKASKATIAALEKQLHSLSSSHTTAAAAARLAAAVTKAAYQDQVKATQAVGKAAAAMAAQMKAAADKAKQAAQDAATAAKDAARSLVDVLQQEANDLAQSITSFRDQMTQAIQGGGIDFTKLILDANGDNGGLSQLQSNLQNMLEKTKAFAADLQALAKSGASQDLITQIVGLGPDAGDLLAKQLLEGGTSAITDLNSLMKQIQDAAGAGAQNLTDVFYKPGADAIENFIKGLQKAFPELKAALQQIIDYVESSLSGMTADVTSAATKAKNSALSVIGAGGGEGSPSQITKTTKLGVVGAAANHAAATVGAVTFAPDVVAAVQENTAATRELLAVTAGTNEKFLTLKRTGAI